MPTKITIPVLNAPVPHLPAMPQIDITDNPYTSLEKAAEKIGRAVESRALLDEDERVVSADATMQSAGPTYAHDLSRAGITGEGLTYEVLKAYDAKGKSLIGGARTHREAKRIEQSVFRHRGAAIEQAMRLEALGRQLGYVTRAQDTMSELANRARIDPGAIGQVRGAAIELKAEIPEVYHPLIEPEEERIQEEYLRGLIAADPKRAHQLLQSSKAVGISPERREALTHEAAVAIEANDEDAKHQRERIGAILAKKRRLAKAEEQGVFEPELYASLIDTHLFDPELGREIEALTGEAHERIHAAAKMSLRVADALATGTALTWDDDHLKSLDAHVAAVAADAPPDVAAKRKTALAVRAGRVPPKLRAEILSSLRASDPARRLAGAKMLVELDDDGGIAHDWAPADIRDTARKISSLLAAGFDEAAALNRIDALKNLGPAQEEARGHHFDTTIASDTLARALKGAFGTDITGVTMDDDNLQRLAYRPEEGEAEPHTADYRPGSDPVALVPVLQRDSNNEIEFTSNPEEDRTLIDPKTKRQYHVREGFVVTNKGTPVYARQNLSTDPRLTSNCHGYTLADNKFWINPREAEKVLKDEFSKLNAIQDVQVNDIVVYRDRNGEAAHSARVTKVLRDANGQVTGFLVIGKRGSVDYKARETDIATQWPGRPEDRYFYRRTSRP